MRAILIDDEERARAALRQLILEHCPQIALLGEAGSGAEGLELARKLQPELIFLDVEMPDMNGFQLLEQLPRAELSVIFVTAFEKYAIQAFRYSAIGYLLKPVDPLLLVQAVQQVEENLHRKTNEERYKLLIEVLEAQRSPNRHNHRIVINTQDEMVFLHLDDLIHIEADGNRSCIYALGQPKPILVAKTLKEYVSLLEDVPFMMQVHRSFLVNLRHVIKLVKGDHAGVMIRSYNGSEPMVIPVSPALKAELIARLSTLE